MSLAVRKIDQMFQMYSGNGNVSTKDIKKFIKFVKKQAEQSEIKCVFDLSENAFAQLMMLLNSQLDRTQNEYLNSKSDEQRIIKRINETPAS